MHINFQLNHLKIIVLTFFPQYLFHLHLMEVHAELLSIKWRVLQVQFNIAVFKNNAFVNISVSGYINASSFLFFFSFSDSFLFLLNNIKIFVWCINVHRPFAVTVLLPSRTITVYLLLRKAALTLYVGLLRKQLFAFKIHLKKNKIKKKWSKFLYTFLVNTIV